MPVQSKLQELLPAGFGYVVFTAVGSAFVNTWLAINVGKARKTHGISYPDMYSSDNPKFNCIQRAHQHFLEGYPLFLTLLFVGGLQYPVISAGAGVLYLAGRVVFAMGYYTGDPSKRKRGAFSHVGLLVLLGSTISFACRQLGWCDRFNC